jgi:rhodanese-related sulfurtransferase
MKNISVENFKKILETEKDNTSIACINVCTPIEYADKYIEGVENMPLDTLEENLTSLRAKDTIYVHCISGERATEAIKKLQQHGITADLVNVTGGLDAWQQAGFSTSSHLAKGKLSLMRQVFLTAGLLILIGIVGYMMTHNTIFLYISGFVGLGLTFSGATGWCGLQLLLSKMPWNKLPSV